MSRIKTNPKKKKSIMPKVEFEVEILADLIGGRPDKSKCIRLSMNPEAVLKREFDFFDLTPDNAYALKEKLGKALDHIKDVADAYNTLDEIDTHLESMQSTVTEARDRIADMENETAIDDISSDLDGDMRDLTEAVESL
jgi:DNA repair ATPase RecN